MYQVKTSHCCTTLMKKVLITGQNPTNPNNPLVSATINLIPLAWQKSPAQICSSRLDCVSTTTWKKDPITCIIYNILVN